MSTKPAQHRIVATLLVAMGLSATGCGEATAPVAAEVPSLTQAQIDVYTGSNIISAISDIYNQNVAGRAWPGTSQTFGCPNGGSVALQGGVAGSSNGLTTVDLTFTMTNCREVKAHSAVTYTGVITWKGSFSSSTNYVSETIKSTGLVTMNGTITYSGFEDAVVSQTVPFTINRNSSSYSGEIDGRTFSCCAG